MSLRHFLEIDDLSPAELVEVLDRAGRADLPRTLTGRSVALYFEKPSLRTRHSCEVAVVELGGHPLTFRRDEVGSGERESVGDIARVLSGYHAALGGRVYDHGLLEELAAGATVPVLNLLSDRGHPCQALADLLTMRQSVGELAGQTVAWVGDFNNVARSLSLGATLLGMKVRLGCPPGYGPDEADIDGPGGRGRRPAPGVRGLHGRRPSHGPGRARRDLHALPAGPPGRGGHRGRGRRSPEPGDRPGPQPVAQLPGPAVLADRPGGRGGRGGPGGRNGSGRGGRHRE
jgi:aspartate/ornithine carbamoyltransferase-like protein